MINCRIGGVTEEYHDIPDQMKEFSHVGLRPRCDNIMILLQRCDILFRIDYHGNAIEINNLQAANYKTSQRNTLYARIFTFDKKITVQEL